MTTTFEDIYRRSRQNGLDHDAATKEAQIHTAHVRQHEEAVQRAAAEAAVPAERRPAEWEIRLADGEQRWNAHWEGASNPMRASQAAAQRARIEAQARPLVEQRDALNRQIAALDEEYRRWR